jgi:beta-galactosidase
MWSIGNEVGERTGVSDGVEWCRRQADLVRALDPTRPVTSALPALFEEMPGALGGEGMESVFDFLDSAPTDPQTDRWGNRTAAFLNVLDVAGYNYLSNRYAPDGQTYPERVICGTETWPHRAYAFWDATSRLPHVIGDFVWTAIDYLGEAGIGRVSLDEQRAFSAPYPYHLANCGDIDICGFKRPQGYYRDILWGVRTAPYIAVLDPELYGAKIHFNPWGWEPVIDSWTFPGREGQPTTVEVYCADDEVELLINGVSQGRKPAGAANRNKAAFDVTYTPGEIVAIAYADGVETARTALVTAGEPAALRLAADRTALDSAYGDLAYVTVEAVDRDGAVVRCAEQEVTLEVSGAGDLLAVGAANPVSEELYVGSQRKAYQGRLMAVVRSTGQAGEIRLRASAEGLADLELRLRAS